MTVPRLSVDTPRGRMYRVEPDGPPVHPSITNVSGVRSKEFLQAWHAKRAGARAIAMFEYLAKHPDRAAAEIQRVTSDPKTTEKRISAAAADEVAIASDFGTFVHAACEQWSRDDARPDRDWLRSAAGEAKSDGAFARERSVDDLLERVAIRLDGYGKFLDDFGPEFVEIEQTVINESVGYAGTTDAIVRLGGATLSADIKTSRRVHGDYALQGVAVCRAEELLDDDGSRRPAPDLAGAFVIHLPERGGYAIVPLATGEKQWSVFKALRAAWEFDEDAARLPDARDPKALLTAILRAGPLGGAS